MITLSLAHAEIQTQPLTNTHKHAQLGSNMLCCRAMSDQQSETSLMSLGSQHSFKDLQCEPTHLPPTALWSSGQISRTSTYMRAQQTETLLSACGSLPLSSMCLYVTAGMYIKTICMDFAGSNNKWSIHNVTKWGFKHNNTDTMFLVKIIGRNSLSISLILYPKFNHLIQNWHMNTFCLL